MGEGGKIGDPEPYAEEAKFFTEARLLHRDVKIVLESVSNQNFLGSIIHPVGNISEFLLGEGLAKCVDWSMAVVTGGPEKLRAAEKAAKERRLRVWREYTPATTGMSESDINFTSKVVEIGMGDSLIVKKGPNEFKKIFLSSIRPPRMDDFAGLIPNKESIGRQFRPLYDIPFMFEAREFLRKKIIGKKVQVTVDYVQEASENFPEKTCCTVIFGGQNLAEALITKGLCTVVRYRQGEEKRSLVYDQLLSAEEKAKKTKKGIHSLKSGDGGPKESKGEPPIVRVQELQGDYNKSKQFLPYLQRAGRSEGIVEFVASGSRVRLFVPKETCLITFLLSGISCPRGGRVGPGGVKTEAEPFGDEAALFTKNLCMQQEVQFEVETMDKAGNFVGYLFFDGANMSVSLVEAGLANVHFTAERSKYYSQLLEAEARAKLKKLKIFENYSEEISNEEREAKDNAVKERTVDNKTVVVTEVDDESLRFFVQHVDQGPKLEQMMVELRADFSSNPPTPGAYAPKRGDICAALFSQDKLWYRARIESVKNPHHIEVLFVDFGNAEVTAVTQLAALPAAFASIPPGAHEVCLAFIKVPDDADYAANASDAFAQAAMRHPELLMNTEYRAGAQPCVTLTTKDTPAVDIGKQLLEDGYAMLESRREARFSKMMTEYKKAEDAAKKNRLNIWRYGDFTGDEL